MKGIDIFGFPFYALGGVVMVLNLLILSVLGIVAVVAIVVAMIIVLLVIGPLDKLASWLLSVAKS